MGSGLDSPFTALDLDSSPDLDSSLDSSLNMELEDSDRFDDSSFGLLDDDSGLVGCEDSGFVLISDFGVFRSWDLKSTLSFCSKREVSYSV